MVKRLSVLPVLISFMLGFLLVASCDDQDGGYPSPQYRMENPR